MSTTALKDTKSTTAIPGQPGSARRPAVPSSTSTLLSSRRVNAPRAVIGGLGVVVCSIGAVAASHVLDPRTPVLVVTQPVAAGQLITAADVRPVPLAAGSGIDVIPAGQVATVVGRPATLPLTAGSLLSSTDVGPTVLFPPAGQAVAAVGLKSGMYPLHLAAGDRVQVVLPAQPGGLPAATPSQSAASTAQAQPLVATVAAVGRPDTQGVMVANLLMDTDGAAKVAAASTSMSGVAVTLLPAGES